MREDEGATQKRGINLTPMFPITPFVCPTQPRCRPRYAVLGLATSPQDPESVAVCRISFDYDRDVDVVRAGGAPRVCVMRASDVASLARAVRRRWTDQLRELWDAEKSAEEQFHRAKSVSAIVGAGERADVGADVAASAAADAVASAAATAAATAAAARVAENKVPPFWSADDDSDEWWDSAQVWIACFDASPVFGRLVSEMRRVSGGGGGGGGGAAASGASSGGSGSGSGKDDATMLSIVDKGCLRDVALLDMLIKLSECDAIKPEPHSLAEIVHDYAPWAEAIVGEAASGSGYPQHVLDAFCCAAAYESMVVRAAHNMDRYRDEYLPGVLAKYGFLTDVIQVKGSLALSQITQNGIHVDLPLLHKRAEEVEAEVKKIISELTSHADYSCIFHKNADGTFATEEGHLRPRINQDNLREQLKKAAAEVDPAKGLELPCSKKDGIVDISTWKWKKYCTFHPFVKLWFDMEHLSKVMTYVTSLLQTINTTTTPNGPLGIVHPIYFPLVRNGRASCHGPNIQITPASGGFREMYIPSPGSVFVIADYSFIELCTLAAVCESRYKFSVLAQVIRDGTDPHCFTAAMFLGMSLQAFMALKESNDPEDNHKFHDWRQRAKSINFGIPGGWSPQALREYALTSYGVELSRKEAINFRDKLVGEVYPEIGFYLYEDSFRLLAANLNASLGETWTVLWGRRRSARAGGAIRSVLRGNIRRKDGTPFEEEFVKEVWAGITQLIAKSNNPTLQKLLAAVEAGPQAEGDERKALCTALHDALFAADAVTSTGRIRCGTTFTKARNTPFSGLAADGAKLAMWNLTRTGYKVVAFVHDEIVVEIPDAEDHILTREVTMIEKILCTSMQELTRKVPISCKLALSRRWCKDPQKIKNPFTNYLGVYDPPLSF
ncbi:DNA polymerase family A [Pelomyxa schiedti]|nr:DNA polymerase family A [Pelomyxa schiedti]